MRRIPITPRPDWQARCESIGFQFHTIEYAAGEDPTYWDEKAYYEFNSAQIDTLEAVSNELYQLCLSAVDYIVKNNYFQPFNLSPAYQTYIKNAWERQDPALYGRFDLAWNGSDNPPKLLEFNADTPTALYEASVVQWHWLNEQFPHADQFNSIHEKLIDEWQRFRFYHTQQVYFTVVRDHPEDEGTVNYLRDTALQAGLDIPLLYIDEIGWNGQYFTDLQERKIEALFKLYPWEWLLQEPISEFLLADTVLMIEPAWKILLSNKAILPILWELNPHHPNLLPSYFTAEPLNGTFIEKPTLSREGENVRLVIEGKTILATTGNYANEAKIYQAYQPIEEFSGNYPVLGSWIVGDSACGLGVREDKGPITKNSSRFVPHLFLSA
ncbi:glutathionylspermidine synthase family protein [Beggiatoa leptomitoformis]|uniref:Glutathionylspermidine synthase family protein n=1 Tax=Beggiatoa leptomitoformis TaxID=288004 RepID=A0A2N9YD64_9GAMM|nr:glutathionylspermidine synthase family protein [Beggiatoa leptomitoformis]ALG69169.1 glutathionylspermidine synthase family protein [Beggiatoa leptomitoformis]AUI68407.1 glutathionylspermidine synthase family protein [Beggiatoa leptomitoformis]